MNHVGVEVVDGGRPGREDGDAPAGERLDRAQAQLDSEHGHVFELADRRRIASPDEQDEIGHKDTVGVQVGRRVLPWSDDEDAAVDRHRRNGGSAPVEDRDVGPACRRELGTAGDVGGEDLAREPTAGPPAADRRHPRERGRLQVVGSGVTAGARDLEQALERGRSLDELRLSRATSAHRDDDDLGALRQQTREMPGDCGLPDPLPGSDHGQRRHRRERQVDGRLEAEVGADVPETLCEGSAGPQHALARAQDRLVR